MVFNPTFLHYVQCSVCPPDNVNIFEWNGNELSCGTYKFSLVNMMTIKEASRYTPEIMIMCFYQFVLFLKITAVFFFF